MHRREKRPHAGPGPPPGRLSALFDTLGLRLALLLVLTVAATMAILGWSNIRLHRHHLERAALLSAERVSDLIERSTTYGMLRNDREGLYHIIDTIEGEPGVVGIRIYNQEGRITLSTNPGEAGAQADLTAEACSGCHGGKEPLHSLGRPDRFRIYQAADGSRVLGIINPIENQPDCSSAECHAHPPSQKVLGVLDTSLSLAQADADLAEGVQKLLGSTAVALAVIAAMSVVFVWWMVQRPVRALKIGTRRLAGGDLGYQIDASSPAELGELAMSFNAMSRDLSLAREENLAWTRTLESRVEEKSREVQRAYEHMVHVEKMASIGKLAATIAHEINNPLSGILTYAKLARKRIQRGGAASALAEAELREPLQVIESESRRCGEIVKNLLRFSRAAPMNMDWADINIIVERTIRLISHRIDLAAIHLREEPAPDLPPVRCDASQIEQALLAVVINAIEAMPNGGNLRIATGRCPQTGRVRIEVEDDGIGIPPEIRPSLFEPFFTTKEGGHGVGLGLAVSKGIVERHGGAIEVTSAPGKLTRFVLVLPAEAAIPAAAETTA